MIYIRMAVCHNFVGIRKEILHTDKYRANIACCEMMAGLLVLIGHCGGVGIGFMVSLVKAGHQTPILEIIKAGRSRNC